MIITLKYFISINKMVGLDLKGQKVHGMKDERWTVMTKLTQLKQVISLQKRDSVATKYQRDTTRRREDRLLGELRKEAKKKQDSLRNALLGNQQKMWSTLALHREIQLAHGRNTTEQVINILIQMIDHKRKTKDRLHYKKRLMMVKYKKLVLEKSKMVDLLIMHKRGIKTPEEISVLEACNNRQVANMRRIAATSVREIYIHILRTLYKDSVYYNSVLDCLEFDCKIQSKMLIAVIEMGQVVTEYVDDIKCECADLEKMIRQNMIERERALNEFENVLNLMKKSMIELVPPDFEDYFRFGDKRSESLHSVSLEQELENIQEVLSRIQQDVLVSKYDDIYPRLVLQSQQRARLQDLKEKLTILYQALKTREKHLNILLNLCKHTYNKNKIKYLEAKVKLLRDIKKQQNRVQTAHSSRMVMWKDLLAIRKGFMHIRNMLKCVHLPGEIKEITKSPHNLRGRFPFTIPIPIVTIGPLAPPIFPSRDPVEKVPQEDVIDELWALIIKKLKLLYSEFKPNGDLVRKAELLFTRDLMVVVSDDVHEADVDLLAGVEIEHSGLPTYQSVKQESAQFVKDNSVDELAIVAAQVAAKKKPGAYFRKLLKQQEQQRKSNKCCSVYADGIKCNKVD